MKRSDRVRDAVPPGASDEPKVPDPDPGLLPGEPIDGGKLSRWSVDAPQRRR
jgi:hypothetical protein